MSGSGAPVLLAVDLGSSSVRATWYSPEGVATGIGAQRAYLWRTGPDGRMEVGFDELLDVCVEVIDDAVSALRETGGKPVGVAVAAFWHGIGAVGADDRPVSPLVGWGDGRSASSYDRLRAALDPREYHRRTGCALRPWYPASRIGLFPGGPGSGGMWMSIGEYLVSRLHGDRVISLSQASGTGLLDTRTLEWDEETLAAANVSPSNLCRLVDVDEPVRGLREPWRSRWPELAEVPWLPPLGDGACANVGLGAVGPDRIGITVGTSAAVRVLWRAEKPEFPEELWCYRLDGSRLVAGGALSNAGNGIARLRRILRLPEGDGLEAVLAAAEEGLAEVTVLPDLHPERDGRDAGEGAILTNLVADTDPAAIAVAWMRTVALRIARIAGQVEEAVGGGQEARAGGGAVLQSPTWGRLLAAALERDLHVPDDAESTSRGAALVAAAALGHGPQIEKVSPATGDCITPDPARISRMRAARERVRRLESRFEITH